MNRQITPDSTESIIFALRSLFDSYGYAHYKMSKFEEYDLYSKNKDFLVSDGVITFTDTNGKLMALKPDVTLSIVKNTNDTETGVYKLCYDENVYRVSKGTRSFRELMQAGLECIGKIDDYCIFEVLTLAAKSLQTISESSLLDISNLGILSELIESAGIPESEKSDCFRLIGEKNLHELTAKCLGLGVDEKAIEAIKQLVALRGAPASALPRLESCVVGMVSEQTLCSFKRIVSALSAQCDNINIDFSVVDDINYYNGIVFKGFVEGVPSSVLSGGQYDSLMKRMKRKNGAIGFAVYLDLLEYLDNSGKEFDVDTVLLYDDNSAFEEVEKLANALRSSGAGVLTAKEVPDSIRYRALIKAESAR